MKRHLPEMLNLDGMTRKNGAPRKYLRYIRATGMLMPSATVVIVLVFDYTNGFHDAANIVATVIASRAMTPAQAVIIVGVFEFLGPLLGGTAVANTIGKFVALNGVQPILSLAILLCGLIGAIVWNLATWYFGIPSSSSHALVGGHDRCGRRRRSAPTTSSGASANWPTATSPASSRCWPRCSCRR
jgi:hypothetical protein